MFGLVLVSVIFLVGQQQQRWFAIMFLQNGVKGARIGTFNASASCVSECIRRSRGRRRERVCILARSARTEMEVFFSAPPVSLRPPPPRVVSTDGRATTKPFTRELLALLLLLALPLNAAALERLKYRLIQGRER